MNADNVPSGNQANPVERLVGEQVVSVHFQGSLRVDIGIDPGYLLKIEGQFVFSRGGESHHLRGTPYDPRMEELRALTGHRIATAQAYADGRLEISMDDGDSIACGPDGKYEPWQVSGPEGFVVVSMPSGALEIW
jgi:hypothetical protein